LDLLSESQEKFSGEKANGLKEKIAVVKIHGAIGEAAARKAEKAFRKIKEQKDIKCVVLRVDSPGGSINACETIYQEIQDMPQKVVVSFGNVSASGGYYISANADRIFASPTTITGSIGVVLMRMDFRGLAKQYGVSFDSIPTSSLSGSFDPFYPLNGQMNENFVNGADRAYYRFKSIVSEGRDLDMAEVEKMAQGRVFLGEQAQQYGLVDELGGLHRAIAYAQRNFTSSGQAEVVQWPPKKSLLDFILGSGKEEEDDDFENLELPNVLHVALTNLMGDSDWLKNSPLAHYLSSSSFDLQSPIRAMGAAGIFKFPLATSGVMLTADENTAIQCLLEDNDIPQAKLLKNISPFFWE
jgi:protease-4